MSPAEQGIFLLLEWRLSGNMNNGTLLLDPSEENRKRKIQFIVLGCFFLSHHKVNIIQGPISHRT